MNLDIIPNGAIKRVHVSQNDVGRTLTFELFNNSTSYTVPSGATVKIQGTKPSGFGFSETCAVSGNTATIDTTEAMTDESGNIQTELSISYDDVVIGTSNFVLAVEKNPHPSNTTDGTQITAQSLEVRIEALEEAIESGGSGLTDEAKQALLNCFAHVAWIDEHGQDYYDALEDALYPPATLTSISAVYTQSGTVYDTDSLDDLKTDLVVTANYEDGTSETVANYTLSGTLEEGTSTITVTYGGMTTTFDVTVTTSPTIYTITNTLSNATNSNGATSVYEGDSYNATITANSGYALSTVTVTMGGTDVTSTVYSNGTITIASVSGNIVITVTTQTYETPIYDWDFTTSLTDTVGGLTATLNNGATQDSAGLHLNGISDYVVLGEIYAPGRTYEVDIANSGTLSYNSNGRLLVNHPNYGAQHSCGIVYRGSSSAWSVYENAWGTINSTVALNGILGKTLVFVIGESTTEFYIDDALIASVATIAPYTNAMFLGSTANTLVGVTITGLRVYES